ncbi:MAG: regulatory protein GemA [Pseudomonadota bacterium]
MTRQLQRTIHVGCRQLGIDDDARRDLQLVATGKTSMSDMDEADLGKVLKALKAKGFKPTAARKPKYRQAPRADLRLCHVLWGKLGEATALEKPGRDGLNAFVRKTFEASWGSVPADIDMLRDPAQINAVIQALLAWCNRVGADVDYGRFRS